MIAWEDIAGREEAQALVERAIARLWTAPKFVAGPVPGSTPVVSAGYLANCDVREDGIYDAAGNRFCDLPDDVIPK